MVCILVILIVSKIVVENPIIVFIKWLIDAIGYSINLYFAFSVLTNYSLSFSEPVIIDSLSVIGVFIPSLGIIVGYFQLASI
jgi:hypothetical protein